MPGTEKKTEEKECIYNLSSDEESFLTFIIFSKFLTKYDNAEDNKKTN